MASLSKLFSSKDDTRFKEALDLYENKHYKRAIRILDEIIQHNPKHYESISLKGLALSNSDLPEKCDAFKYIDRACKEGGTDSVVCHIAGLYYRGLKEYKQASKWYSAAMENKSPNKGILRDLSSCLTQIRDYKHLLVSRLGYLESQPAYRANWTSAAIAHCLNGQYDRAEDILTRIEDLVSGHLSEDDMFEQSECLLLKNRAIYKQGDVSRALEHLEKIAQSGEVGDGAKLLEYKAQYLEELQRPEDASVVYRLLLKRNPDNAQYYHDLERCLGTEKMSANVRLALYEKLCQFYPRADPPKFIPLTFLKSDQFVKKAEEYILSQLRRGAPATFVNVKPLYRRRSNQKVIYDIVKKFYDEEKSKLSSSDADNAENGNPLRFCWAGYFLAQHFYRVRDYSTALKFIDEAISTTPTLVELYIVKARIFKRMNRLCEACDTMNEARKLDLQDRFINTKAAKYYLRANKVKEAIDTASLFTRNEKAPNGVQDLHLMQCYWFLIESAEAYGRLAHESLREWKKLTSVSGDQNPENADHEAVMVREHLRKKTVHLVGLAIKRYRAIVKVFEEYEDDQFDFHHYSMRKGTARTYLTMLNWEDRLYHQPIFLRAAKGLANAALAVLNNKPFFQVLLTNPTFSLNRTKKEKKAEEKQREELVRYSKSFPNDTDVFAEVILRELADVPIKNAKKSSTGGFAQYADKGTALTRLADLAKRANDEKSLDGQEIVFRVNRYFKKYVLCLQAMNHAYTAQPSAAVVGYLYLDLLKARADKSTPDTICRILVLGLKRNFSGLLSIEGDDCEKLAEGLVQTFFAGNDYSSVENLVRCEKLQPTGTFEKRIQEIKQKLDPYSLRNLSYFED